MSEDKDIKCDLAAAQHSVDDAVGVPEAQWFIAIVNCRSEKSVAEKLTRLGVDNYLPVQEELHVWKNGKKARVDKVVIPSKIFIKCTEIERRNIVNLPFIFRFMTNSAGGSSEFGRKPLATVPNHEITRLKFMLGVPGAKVSFAENFVKGQLVEVLRGPFRGLKGEILHDADGTSSRLYINIDFLGSASVEIKFSDVKIIDGK